MIEKFLVRAMDILGTHIVDANSLRARGEVSDGAGNSAGLVFWKIEKTEKLAFLSLHEDLKMSGKLFLAADLEQGLRRLAGKSRAHERCYDHQ